jgi:Spy/CpxP family protein refolding chaperone
MYLVSFINLIGAIMKKKIFISTMCVVLTATSIFAVETNNNVQKITQTVTQSKCEKQDLSPKHQLSKEERLKHFEAIRKLHREHFYKEVGLSDEQKLKAEEIELKSKEELKPLLKKIHLEREKLRTLRKEKASVFAIWKQENAFKNAKKDLKNYMEVSKKSFEAILTKEQKEKVESIHNERKHKMKNSLKHHRRHKHHEFYKNGKSKEMQPEYHKQMNEKISPDSCKNSCTNHEENDD